MEQIENTEKIARLKVNHTNNYIKCKWMTHSK